MSSKTDIDGLRVLIVGGGVAALEAAPGAPARGRRAHSGRDPRTRDPLHLQAAGRHGAVPRRRGADVSARGDRGRCRRVAAPWRIAAVDTGSHLARTDTGDEVPYDVLLLAYGAWPVPAVPGALTFAGRPEDEQALTNVLADARQGRGRRIAFVVPTGRRGRCLSTSLRS